MSDGVSSVSLRSVGVLHLPSLRFGRLKSPYLGHRSYCTGSVSPSQTGPLLTKENLPYYLL